MLTCSKALLRTHGRFLPLALQRIRNIHTTSKDVDSNWKKRSNGDRLNDRKRPVRSAVKSQIDEIFIKQDSIYSLQKEVHELIDKERNNLRLSDVVHIMHKYSKIKKLSFLKNEKTTDHLKLAICRGTAHLNRYS